MIKQTKYIDDKTGEIFKTDNKFVNAQFDEGKGYLFWSRKNHNKIYHDIDFPEQISDNELGKLFKLSQYIYSNTNLLAYRGNGGVKPYDIVDISKVINLNEKRTKLFMQKMVKYKIIAKVNIEFGEKSDIHYYLNPVYFFSGSRIPLNLYLIFRNELDNILPEWVRLKYNEINKNTFPLSAGNTLYTKKQEE